MHETDESLTDGDGAARATSDELMAAIHRLVDAETRKRQVATDTPEFVRLAVVADEAGKMVARWTASQLDTASKASRLVADGVMSGRPIERVTPRPVSKVLAEWREAEFRLSGTERGTPEAQAAASDVARLRAEYHAGISEISARHARSEAEARGGS